MGKFSVLETWLESVSPSDSKGTRDNYRRRINSFCNFIGESPSQTLRGYRKRKTMIERDNFKGEYAIKIRAWYLSMKRQGFTRNTLHTSIAVVKSFFRNNDMPVGSMPKIRRYTQFHNRDITHEEVKIILSVSNPRERAAYSLMAQSGLRPHTLSQLQIEDFEDIQSDDPTIPQKISVPQKKAKGEFRKYFTFCGADAVKHIKDYLKTRGKINGKSWLFTKRGHEDKHMGRSSVSVLFTKTVEGLQRSKVLDFEIRKGKPSQLYLYTLRKFFRKYAGQAGFDYVHYWMGHALENQDEHYFSKTDVELHRKIYREKAAPHLKLLPSHDEQRRVESLERKLEKKDREIQDLNNRMMRLEALFEKN